MLHQIASGLGAKGLVPQKDGSRQLRVQFLQSNYFKRFCSYDVAALLTHVSSVIFFFVTNIRNRIFVLFVLSVSALSLWQFFLVSSLLLLFSCSSSHCHC